MPLTENFRRSDLIKNHTSTNMAQFLFGGLARVMTASFLMQPLSVMKSTMRMITGASQSREYQPTSQTVLSILNTNVVLRRGYTKIPIVVRESATPRRPYFSFYNIFEKETFFTIFLKTFLGIKKRDMGAFVVTPAAAALSRWKKPEDDPKPDESPKTGDDDDGRKGRKAGGAVFDAFLKDPGKHETFWQRPYRNYYNRYYSQW